MVVTSVQIKTAKTQNISIVLSSQTDHRFTMVRFLFPKSLNPSAGGAGNFRERRLWRIQ